ncbi:hypothetical protein DsansV1_C02g0018071 [Dioscorea sansibarensis]
MTNKSTPTFEFYFDLTQSEVRSMAKATMVNTRLISIFSSNRAYSANSLLFDLS